MARYTYDPSPIVGLAQAILSYANGILWRASIAGGITGVLVVGGILISSGQRQGQIVIPSVIISMVVGALIFRSVVAGRVLILRASAQMLLLMVRIEENTRPE